MPFIKTNVSTKVSTEKEIEVKAAMAKALGMIGKSEGGLMVQVVDECKLYLAGNQDGETAYVKVEYMGTPVEKELEKMTECICTSLEDILGIPAARIYVTYQSYKLWGCDKKNF